MSCPVILKEVGSGMSPADADLALANGVTILDVAGSGGTSWSRIEHHRHDGKDTDGLGIRFQDWGVPTPYVLKSLAGYRDRMTLIASGGIRSGQDMVKAMILGASLSGLASPFLAPAMESVDAVIAEIKRLQREVTTAMFLLGVSRIEDLIGRGDLIRKACP
jgi:isopentenyl-diphosphate delta-isomerase